MAPAATASRRRIKKVNLDIPVDERTADLSNQALRCRGGGHRWEDQAMTRRQTLDNLNNGVWEERKACRCGQSIRELWSIREQLRIVYKREYPKGGTYLLPKGSGRLSRKDAMTANIVRQVSLIV